MISWYALNAERGYPLVDSTAPEDLIVDLCISCQKDPTDPIYLLALRVSDSIVSAVFGTTTEALLSISAPAPAVCGAPLQLTSFDGVSAGFIVFGDGVQTFRGTVELIAVDQRAVTYRQASGVVFEHNAAATSLQLSCSDVLEIFAATGEVSSTADADYVLYPRNRRYIDGAFRDAIVIRMKESSGDSSYAAEIADSSCNSTAALTCSSVTPLRTLCGIAPNCDGNLTLIVENADLTTLTGAVSGLSVDYAGSLSDSCTSSVSLLDTSDDLCDGGSTDDYTTYYSSSTGGSTSGSDSCPSITTPYIWELADDADLSCALFDATIWSTGTAGSDSVDVAHVISSSSGYLFLVGTPVTACTIYAPLLISTEGGICLGNSTRYLYFGITAAGYAKVGRMDSGRDVPILNQRMVSPGSFASFRVIKLVLTGSGLSIVAQLYVDNTLIAATTVPRMVGNAGIYADGVLVCSAVGFDEEPSVPSVVE